MPNTNNLLLELTHEEKSALRILSALGGISMNEHVRREAIRELWLEYFPHLPLGQAPEKREKKFVYKHNEGERE